MIGRIRGILEIKKPPFLLIEVGGIGYECQAPMSTIYHLPDIGKSVTLLTHLQIREDAHVLYAFHDERERAFFRALIKISGVGPKSALTILSGIEVSAFIQCVERRDIGPLVRLPGVGKKTAERLVVEMAGKLKSDSLECDHETYSDKLFESKEMDQEKRIENDAISALIALGYKPQEASKAIFKVKENSKENNGKEMTSQELIRSALQNLSKVIS